MAAQADAIVGDGPDVAGRKNYFDYIHRSDQIRSSLAAPLTLAEVSTWLVLSAIELQICFSPRFESQASKQMAHSQNVSFHAPADR